MAERGHAATLRQVAAHAGVSRQPVSHVLNAPERVEEATLHKVRAAIESLGYQPSRAARSLATRRAGLVGYCLPCQPGRGLFMDPFPHGLTGAIEATGRRVLVLTAPDGARGLAASADLIAQRAVDGFVLSDTVDQDPRHVWLAGRGVPFVSFGRTWPEHGEQAGTRVDVDGAGACAELVTRLHSVGHDRIAFLGWCAPSPTGAADDRRRGWRDACRRLGLPELSRSASRRRRSRRHWSGCWPPDRAMADSCCAGRSWYAAVHPLIGRHQPVMGEQLWQG